MTRLRTTFAALSLVVAMTTASAGNVFATSRHPVCEAKQHECGQVAKISSCCCGDLGAPRDSGVPAQARIDVVGGTADVAAPPHCAQVATISADHNSIHTSPPGLYLVDIPTLFATLLI